MDRHKSVHALIITSLCGSNHIILHKTSRFNCYAVLLGGTKKDSWIKRNWSLFFCHVRLFFADTLRMNTLLPTAVAATRLWGLSSL